MADQTSPSRGSGKGWYVPGDAANPPPIPEKPAAAHVPLPTDALPLRPGGWFVPGDATERVSEMILAESAEHPAAAAAADALSGGSPAPSGATNPPIMDYSSYVPGVGFVSKDEAAQLRAEEDNSAVLAQEEPPISDDQPTVLEAPIKADETPAPQAQPVQAEPIPVTMTVVETDDQAALSPPVEEPSAEAQPAEPTPDPMEVLAQKYAAAENAVRRSRRQYAAGLINRDQLNAELRKHMVLDNNNQYWVLGVESDRWFRHDGSQWVADTPPGYKGHSDPDLPLYLQASKGAKPAVAPKVMAVQPLDGGSVPRRVPIEDESATMVGKWAMRLDNEAGTPKLQPTDVGATVPNKPISVDSGATVASKPYEAQTVMNAAVQPGGASIPSPKLEPLASGASGAPLKIIQPDYGPRPNDVMTKQQLGGCLIRASILGVFLVMAGAILGTVGSVLFYGSIINRYRSQIDNLPNTVNLESQSVRFFDSTGSLLYQMNDPNLGARLQVQLKDISPYLIHAVIATENERFYTDPGFDIIAIMRAVLQNVAAGGITSGASTITQQLARARVLDPGAATDTSTGRKLDEVIVSSEIARRYTKSQILEYYLNTVYFGNLAYGIEAASQTYFNKSAKDLNLAEASFLAGMIQAPALYDPVTNALGAINRAKIVRDLMLQLGCIQMEHEPYNTTSYCVAAKDVQLAVVQIAQVEAQMSTFTPAVARIKYPHLVFYARQQLEKLFGQSSLYTSGFNVYLTVDPRVQDAAEAAVKSGVASLAAQRATNGAALVIRPTDGAVLAMVGSVDFYNTQIQGQVNVTLAARQPGSALKPFIYLASFERDPEGKYWTPATSIFDVQSCFGLNNSYCPRNFDGRFHGPVSVRTALGNSYNVPAVKAYQYVGVERFKQVAERFGISFPLTSLDQAGLAGALGAAEVTMIDLAYAYAALANNGQIVDPYVIARVTRKEGDQEAVIYQAQPPAPRQVGEPGITYLITSILADNGARTAAFGANSALVLRNGHLAAAKTGTSNDNRDSWTFGYTPDVVTAVWVGNSDGTPMGNVAGSTGAAPIWNQIMTAALANVAPKQFNAPSTVSAVTVCADFGTQDYTECKERRSEVIFGPNPPPAQQEMFTEYVIDTFSGLRANAFCPDFQEKRKYLNITDQFAVQWLNNDANGQAWAKARGITLPLGSAPQAECQAGQQNPVINVTSPQPGQQVSRLLEITGIVQMPGLNRYQIELGIGQAPETFSIVDGPFGVQGSGFLGRWETNRVPDGVYTIKVWAVDSQGRYAQRLVPVLVNNTNPQIQPTAFPTFAPTQPFAFPTETPNFGIPPTATLPPFDPGFGATPTAPISIFPPTTSP